MISGKFISLSLSFSNWKMKVIISTTTEGGCEDLNERTQGTCSVREMCGPYRYPQHQVFPDAALACGFSWKFSIWAPFIPIWLQMDGVQEAIGVGECESRAEGK